MKREGAGERKEARQLWRREEGCVVYVIPAAIFRAAKPVPPVLFRTPRESAHVVHGTRQREPRCHSKKAMLSRRSSR